MKLGAASTLQLNNFSTQAQERLKLRRKNLTPNQGKVLSVVERQSRLKGVWEACSAEVQVGTWEDRSGTTVSNSLSEL